MDSLDLEIIKEQSYYKKVKAYSDAKIKLCDTMIGRNKYYELFKSISSLLNDIKDDEELYRSRLIAKKYCVEAIIEQKRLETEIDVLDKKKEQALLKLKRN